MLAGGNVSDLSVSQLSSNLSGVTSSLANNSATSTFSGLDIYQNNSILSNDDDIFDVKNKSLKLDLQNANFFGDMSPGNSGMIKTAINENSPASSSSSSLMAAAAVLMQANANNGSMSAGMINQNSNSLGGRTASFSLDNSSALAVAAAAATANRNAGATTSINNGSSAGGSGGSNGDSMQPRQRRKVPEGELCAVCSDRATGYHYGVASCNGCKTFFRRTIVSEHQFVCQYQGNCDVNKNVRCACRHCRFNKCVAVGMDARAIQNDRDRIGPTKKFRLGLLGTNGGMGAGTMMVTPTPGTSGGLGFAPLGIPNLAKRSGSLDEDQTSNGSMSPLGAVSTTLSTGMQSLPAPDLNVIEHMVMLEELCCQLRTRVLDINASLLDSLRQPSLLYNYAHLAVEKRTMFTYMYPASLTDIQMWNVRELKICMEWAKTFEPFAKLTETNRFFMLRHAAFACNLLNRAFYSVNRGPNKIVFPNGAYITREPEQQGVVVPGTIPIFQRQIDEIMLPFRRLKVTVEEFALLKAIIFFNPDVVNLTVDVKPQIEAERTKYLRILFYLLVAKNGLIAGHEKYASMLMMTPSIQDIINQNDDNMQVMEVFGNFWRIHGFVKELCLRPRLEERKKKASNAEESEGPTLILALPPPPQLSP